MPDWKTEEQVLLHIKKMIAVVWRMNSEQLCLYQKKLQKHRQEVLPGRIGSTFLAILEQMSGNPADANTKVWPELMRDANCLLGLIQNQRNWDETAWLAVMQSLEMQADRLFCTELGRSFILALKEKTGIDIPETGQTKAKTGFAKADPCRPGNQDGMRVHITDQTELEKIADWLMHDSQERIVSAESIHNHREHIAPAESVYNHRERIAPAKSIHISAGIWQKAAITVFACLSVCFMGIWLHGQVERNQNRWNLQRMKISASKEADVFMTQYPQEEAVIQTEKQGEAGSPANGKNQQEQYQLEDIAVNSAQTKTGSRRKTKAGANEISGTNSGAQTEGTSRHSGAQTEGTSQNSDLQAVPEILPQYREISAQYPELFGWLQIPGTQIDLPVMRAGGDDPEFYLHHDITGAESAEGALFVDTLSSSYPQDDNTVVYGHNMKNGHIFGTLKMYGTADFFQEHQKIYFDTLYETGVYEAVAVLKTRIRNENEQGFRYYQFFQYENEKEFQECADFVEKNKLFETNGALQYGDRILMLSTCEYSQENGRLVVVAHRIADE